MYSVLSKIILPVFFTLCILTSHSSANTVFDFCVPNLSQPNGLAEYACKDPKKVIVDDFVSSSLATQSNTTNFLKTAATLIETPQFPRLNGMGLSMLGGNFKIGGITPLHTHRVSELLYVVEESVVAGFIDSNNIAYYKKLYKRGMMIFPPTLLHFILNAGSIQVVTLSFFPSDGHGTQIADYALFGGDLPLEMLKKITLLDHELVHKFKKLFGGTDN